MNVLQEFTHQRIRRTRNRAEAAARAREIALWCRLIDVTGAEMDRALDLVVRHPRLDAQDAVYAATALNHSIPVVLSPDRAFDDVEGLRRVDPLDAAAVDALAVG